MKRSDIDFNIPTRQSYVAILMIVYKLYRSLFRQLLPFIVIFLIGGKMSDKTEKITYFIIAAALLGTVYGIVAFFKYYFHLEEDELVIQSGVFQKKKTNIPFERIQTIDFEQNILHQMFSVVALKIDTAGSSGNEFKFDAISREKAEALRELIFSKKSSRSKSYAGDLTEEKIPYDEPEVTEKVLSLGVLDLLKVGITENHIRSFGLILLFGFWILETLEDMNLGTEDIEKYIDAESVLVQGIVYVVSLILFFTILSFAISLIRTVLNYYNLSFLRTSKGFKLIAGLLNRREVAALDNKIQILQWSQNLLQKGLQLYEIKLKQASSIEVSAKKSIKVPGSYLEQVEAVKGYLFKKQELVLDAPHKISVHYFYRSALYLTLLTILLATGFYYFGKYKQLTALVILYFFLLLSFYLSYKKKTYTYNDYVLKINGGTFGAGHNLMHLYKIQSIALDQNMYQRKRDLASLKIYTASGSMTIPYISLTMAEKIFDYMTYKVEKSRRKWM